MSTVIAPQQPEVVNPITPNSNLEVVIYSHSPIVYWWPVWAVGYVMALLTALQGEVVRLGQVDVLVHPSAAMGVVFTMTFLLVILMTHITLRGMASVTMIVTIIAVILFIAYMGWWDNVLREMGKLAIFMNLGFYIFFSTAVFVVWAAAVFVFDRMEYWVFRPGQAIHHNVLGSGEHTYDTRGMVVEKMRDDLFRHWILGLGSGDLTLSTTGAKKIEAVVHNVLFIDSKLARAKQLAAMRPDEDPQLVAPTPTQQAV